MINSSFFSRVLPLAAIAASALIFSAARASEPTTEIRNARLLSTILTQLQNDYSLRCEQGRRPGAFPNPMLCNNHGNGTAACLGTVRFKCLNADGKRELTVKASILFGYGYNEESSTAELRKIVIQPE